MIAAATDNPFPGLRPFEPNQADLFFGRDEQIDDLLDRLEKLHFLAVLGASGSGKSSLVGAGLVPAIQRGYFGGSNWKVVKVRPGRDPFGALAAALSETFQLSSSETESILRRSSLGIIDLVRQRLSSAESLLIVVDQFEELINYRRGPGERDGREESAAFVKLLLAATGHSELSLPHTGDLPIFVVLTMRSNSLGKCAQFRGLPEALNNSQYLVPRMTREQQREAIEGPVGMNGARVAPQLVQRLLNDVGDSPDQLPVLQHALMRMWEESREAREQGQAIDLPHYEAVGGMENALKRDADSAFGKFNGDPARQAIVRRLFQSLVETGVQEDETRRPTPLSAIVTITGAAKLEVENVIGVFKNRGFLTLSNDKDPMVDVSHESLIRLWDMLKAWVEKEAESEKIYLRLEDSAVRKMALYRDPELTQALRWREREVPNAAWAERYSGGHPDAFSRTMDFLERSRRRRLNERVRAFLWAGVILVVISALILWKKEADARASLAAQNIAATFGLAGQAALSVSTDPARALTLGLSSWSVQKSMVPGLDQVLHNALLRPTAWLELPGHPDSKIARVAWSPDGAHIVSAGLEDGKVKVWNLASKLEERSLEKLGSVSDVAWSPDGLRLAIASADKSVADKTVKVWELTADKTRPLQHNAVVMSVAWAVDGNRLAAGATDGSVRVWNTHDWKLPPMNLPAHQKAVREIVWSPNGKFAATSSDSTAKVWDVTTPVWTELQVMDHQNAVVSISWAPDSRKIDTVGLEGNLTIWESESWPSNHPTKREITKQQIRTAAWSPDGVHLATGASNGMAKVWESANFANVGAVSTDQGFINSISWSPKGGSLLATGSRGGTIKLWDLSGGRDLLTLSGQDRVYGIAWSANGSRLASAGADGVLRIWNTEVGQLLPSLPPRIRAWIWGLSWSPDASKVATASQDGLVRVWDVTDGKQLFELACNQGKLWAVAWHPDGSRLAVAGKNKMAIWDLASLGMAYLLEDQVPDIRAIAWSWDGRHLAAGSEDGTAQVWDANGRNEHTWKTGEDHVRSVAWSPDNERLATVAGDNTKVWDVPHEKVLYALSGHGAPVWSVAWSPDKSRIATGNLDGVTRVWSAKTYYELLTLGGHQGPVRTVAWSPDGKLLASAGDDGITQVYAIDTDELLKVVRARITVDLTNEECARFLSSTCPDSLIPRNPAGPHTHPASTPGPRR